MKNFFRRGEPFIWASGLSLAAIISMTILLIGVVIYNGMTVFWPHRLVEYTLADGQKYLGEISRTEKSDGKITQIQLKIGNRDLYSLDFKWFAKDNLTKQTYPEAAFALERQEYGNFYGYLKAIRAPSYTKDIPEADFSLHILQESLGGIAHFQEEKETLEKRVKKINSVIEGLHNKLAKLRGKNYPDSDQRIQSLLQKEQAFQSEFSEIISKNNSIREQLSQNYATFTSADGQEVKIILSDIVRAYQPNAMTLFAKIIHYSAKIFELFTTDPRESNTEGGLFPAIFGTIMLVFLMSLLSFPLGVVAGIYLREYAREGILVKTVRIAVNNLAGIPSIVYGIFGLGFFVYGIGGTIDQLFFPERLPTPTFGTGGILWASLTLGLLTVPVVIVATEEALGAITPGIREGSLALGSTKFQTLLRLLLPMASPGIMTGFILAMARAAGEVAPLMITGVVKLAPALPLDGQFPYIHFDRKFMHLGFHIYDIGFQSPNVEAAKPMVYVTTLLLIMIVLGMCSVAIYLRNKMRKRYAISDI
ncbi:MAG: phosphate ABC transporter permease PstA [Proteobacteria bacterium]|nr:phosphate ABC transporter permease PstA [Pseudomonadota bacterium]MBU1708737.1 phosphate ABC transporter permease PstA [Pseudomonadota bacterium]